MTSDDKKEIGKIIGTVLEEVILPEINTEQKYERLRIIFEDLSMKYEQAITQLNNSKQTIKSLQTSVENGQKEIAELQNYINSLRMEIDEKRKLLDQLRVELVESKADSLLLNQTLLSWEAKLTELEFT